MPDSVPEKKILTVKYSAKPFAQIADERITTHAKAILIKISIITGWSNPEDETFMAVLVEQLAKHLKESYPKVNPNEVDFAFRQYGTNVKEYGKAINLELFDRVMSMYMESRVQASELEFNRLTFTEPVALLEAPKMTNEEKIEKGRKMWETTHRVDYIFPYTFEALVAENIIQYPMDKEVQRRYWKKAELRMLDYEKNDKQFFKNKDRDIWMQAYCRKLVCADYFDGTLEVD